MTHSDAADKSSVAFNLSMPAEVAPGHTVNLTGTVVTEYSSYHFLVTHAISVRPRAEPSSEPSNCTAAMLVLPPTARLRSDRFHGGCPGKTLLSRFCAHY
eukprot:SAG31_NODE_4358_length_3313_cov_2.599876_5_plen_100_part_00